MPPAKIVLPFGGAAIFLLTYSLGPLTLTIISLHFPMKTLVRLLLAALAVLTLPASHARDDEADKALEAARDFADAGEYAKALERHEWYHKNALRINPAQYGVRLSFALSDWKELADKYPPALASLKAIRDADVKELEAGTGNRENFHDVVSINERIGEEAATVTLFKSLDAKQPALAKQCFDTVGETLLNQGEVQLFTKYGGDFVTYLEGEISQHDHMVKMIKSTAGHPMPEHSIKNTDNRLVTTTLKLVALATKQGDTGTATKLKTLAHKSVPDPRIKP